MNVNYQLDTTVITGATMISSLTIVYRFLIHIGEKHTTRRGYIFCKLGTTHYCIKISENIWIFCSHLQFYNITSIRCTIYGFWIKNGFCWPFSYFTTHQFCWITNLNSKSNQPNLNVMKSKRWWHSLHQRSIIVFIILYA